MSPRETLASVARTDWRGRPRSLWALVVLLVVLGLVPLLVAGGLLGGRRWAWIGAVGVAVALAIWVLVEGWIVGFGKRLQYPNLVQSLVMLGLATLPSVRNEY